MRASGTWRPAPGGAPGSYATSLPFLLAGEAGAEPARIAASAGRQAARRGLDRGGVRHRRRLPDRDGHRQRARRPCRPRHRGRAPPARPATRCAARRSRHPRPTTLQRPRPGRRPGSSWPARSPAGWRSPAAPPSTWMTARYASRPPVKPTRRPPWLSRAPTRSVTRWPGPRPQGRSPIDAARCVTGRLENPFFLVRYAHAQAASVLRWAGDLGVERGAADGFRAGLLSHRGELELLAAMSWLPERVAAAARRRRPDVLARHVECVASRWLDCAEGHPALPFGGRAGPAGRAGGVGPAVAGGRRADSDRRRPCGCSAWRRRRECSFTARCEVLVRIAWLK